MDLEIKEEHLEGFNSQAREKVSEATNLFVADLIEESNRIESGRNTTSGPPEITSSMVNDAWVLIRRGLFTPKRSLMIKILRVVSAILALIVGFMYDPINLQDNDYMFLFILVISATIISVTISTMKE